MLQPNQLFLCRSPNYWTMNAMFWNKNEWTDFNANWRNWTSQQGYASTTGSRGQRWKSQEAERRFGGLEEEEALFSISSFAGYENETLGIDIFNIAKFCTLVGHSLTCTPPPVTDPVWLSKAAMRGSIFGYPTQPNPSTEWSNPTQPNPMQLTAKLSAVYVSHIWTQTQFS